MDQEVKKHRFRARFVAILGILPGLWFLLSTHTQFGQRLNIGCGYWIFMLVILTAIWVMYAILTKMILKDIGNAHDYAHSLSMQRHYKMVYMSTAIEALFASIIIILSIVGFIATDIQCFLSSWSVV